jgi:hypothetical protein
VHLHFRFRLAALAAFVPLLAPLAACGSKSDPSADGPDAALDLGGGGYVDAAEPDANKPLVDGGYAGPDGSVVRVDRFVTDVVSFTPGDCAGFGIPKMPGVVQGPPVGAGDMQGSLDVVSLGRFGEIVVGFGANAIVDAPGPDFIVFENAFFANGDPNQPAADLGEVSVSDDGTTWKTFPCTPKALAPYGACAGWHPVYSAPDNAISPFDVEHAGGEAYDLADVGLTHARFVKIRDVGAPASCPVDPPKPTNIGFDLDAVAIVHAELL